MLSLQEKGGEGGGTVSPNSGSDKPGDGGNELEFEPTKDACVL